MMKMAINSHLTEADRNDVVVRNLHNTGLILSTAAYLRIGRREELAQKVVFGDAGSRYFPSTTCDVIVTTSSYLAEVVGKAAVTRLGIARAIATAAVIV
ncbi:hypothetical protein J6590_022879 [Homalodisca vitripennis]|nr:hypothetical protein J6590_022879 [Homalodisca vitripennis]